MIARIVEHSQGRLILEGQGIEDYADQYGEREIELSISLPKRRRSLTANAYAWVLIGKLAAVLRQGKTDIYRAAIREIGGNYDIVRIKAQAVETFCRAWEKDGCGWMTETLGAVCERGELWVDVIAYYGSSAYDSRQMATLIEYLVTECKEQGIETMPPREQADILKRWASRYG